MRYANPGVSILRPLVLLPREVLSLCIIYIGVMCLSSLQRARARVSDTARRRFFFNGTLSIANR